MYEGKPRHGPPYRHPSPRRGERRGRTGPGLPVRPGSTVPPALLREGWRRGTPALPGHRWGAGRGAGLPPVLPVPPPSSAVPGGGRWVKSVPVPSRTMRWTELALRLCVCARVCLPAPRCSSHFQDRPPRSFRRFPWSSPRRGSPPGCGEPAGSGGGERSYRQPPVSLSGFSFSPAQAAARSPSAPT